MTAHDERGCTAAQIRAAERPLLEAGVPLMRRAAAGLAAEVTRLLAERAPDRLAHVVLLVGAGDNGGDTLFAGAELAAAGALVVAVPTGSRIHPAGAAAARAAGVELVSDTEADTRLAQLIGSADVVLDGILGIGGAGSPALRDRAREVVARIRPLLEADTAPLVVAVDLPSGIDADDGSLPDPTVLPADVTVTFGALKAGLLHSPGAELAGDVILIDIGLDLDGLEPATRRRSGAHPNRSSSAHLSRSSSAQRVSRPAPPQPTRIHVRVHGIVQGVGFRWATRAEAERLGVAGWVRNRPDGSVECELEGTPDVVERLLDWLRVGPFGARVDRLDEHAVDPTGVTGFEIRRD